MPSKNQHPVNNALKNPAKNQFNLGLYYRKLHELCITI